ncbi:MAG: cytidine deaminase [Chthoniobacterales bacterium]
MQEIDVLKMALVARNAAYARYSDFKVGAALLTKRDKLYLGCNVENISFGLTMCAERVAVGAALTDGSDDFCLIAIIADSKEPVMPCGACRQVLAEFNPSLRIVSSTLRGQTADFRLDELLPHPTQGILG